MDSIEIKRIVSEMTLEEKAGMCSGGDFWHTKAVERLGVPAMMVSDGPHGLRKQADKADHLGLNESIDAVCFPSAAGTAASFDRALLRELGQALAEECQAEDVGVLLGPAVNIKRSPLCGRNFEYFSEDPYVAGEMAASYIEGVQAGHVGTSIKHFAANNQESRRMTISDVVDERTLREIYLPAFETAVKRAQPWTVMCSYNRINGVYSAENPWLLDQVLRREWGFEGFVMTDWGAISESRTRCLRAGLELEMPASGGINDKKLVEDVRNGVLEEHVLDQAVERILKILYQYVENRDTNAVFDRDAHHEKAREYARNTQVLLKNDGVLPLQQGQKIAFIGAFAKQPRYQGGGSSCIHAHQVVGAWQAAQAQGIENLTYSPGFVRESGDRIDEYMLLNAVEAARTADVAVVFAGLPDSFESEGYDRKHLHLPKCQNVLIEEIAKVQKNIVVVLHNGSPVLMPWLGRVSAVLESYLGGEAVGEAQVDLLFGAYNPNAKLAETFPRALKDTPCWGNFPGGAQTVEYREGLYVGYRYYDTVGADILFPFGFGLSYTQFAYTDASVGARTISEGEELAVRFTLTNTGERDGAEIAQVYVKAPDGAVYHPVHELKGFEKVFLKAGESKTVELTLDARAFQYYDVAFGGWRAQGGDYTIEIGASSRDIRCQERVHVRTASPEFAPADRREEMPAYYTGRVVQAEDSEFEALLGDKIPPAQRDRRRPFDWNDTLLDAKDTKWGGRLIRLINRAKRGKDDPNLLMMVEMITSMPLRVLYTMSSGLFTENMMDGLLKMLNGEGANGLWQVVSGGIMSLFQMASGEKQE